MTFRPSTFKKIIDARGLNEAEASSAASMSQKKLAATLAGENTPTKIQIFNLAERLAVPAFAFFMENYDLPDSEIIDFRAAKPVALKYGKDTHRFVHIIKIRDFLAELHKRLDWAAPENLFSIQLDDNPEQLAAAVGGLLNMNSLREKAKDKADFFKLFRKSVEDLGLYVIQDHNFSPEIDGFAIYYNNFSSNLIFINSSKRNHGAKSFTLAHELSHIFGKRSAISNNYQFDNNVEIFANDFAASLLIPRDQLIEIIDKQKMSFINEEWSIKSATKLSEHFNTSVSAMLVRLTKFGYVKQVYTSKFISGFGSKGFADAIKPESFGGKNGPAPGVIDLAYLGRRAVGVIASALEAGLTTKYEIFEYTGFSKKRIDGLMSIAKEKELVREKLHAIAF